MMRQLAYIIGTFPALTETFVAREIQALEATGVAVELFSLRRPPAGHERADGAELMARTCYGSSLRGLDLWAANRRALRRAPFRYLRTLGAVLLHTTLNPVHAIKSLALFPVAVAFAERIRDRGVAHVHAHWANYPATAAYVVSRLLGIPYSFTAHAHDASLIRSLMREKIRRAAFVMTCTGWNREWLGRLVPAARDKILLNYHGVVLDWFAPDSTGRPAHPDRFTIVSCGSLYPRKGFPHLLEACRLLRDRGWPVDCVILGEGPMRAELQRFIDRHGLGERVQLVGAVAPREVVHHYRQADLFVLACMTDYLGWRELFTDPVLLLEVGPAIPCRPLTDGIPNVLVEAMAMEIPVVSTYVAGIPELIQDGRTGRLVPEKNPAALADVIEQLRRAPEQRRALAVAGRAAVLERFDRYRNIRQLADIFAAGGADGRRSAGVPDGGSLRATDKEGPISRPSRPASMAGHSMSNDRPPGNAGRSPGRYLTHKQAVALLEAVARLLDVSETADGSHGPAISRLVTAMHTVGIDPALIHAYQETGVLVSEGNEDLWSVNDLRRWVTALERYRSRQSPDTSQLARVP